MITKAIIEEILSPYEVRVRIPSIDRVATDSVHTPTKDLNIATVCTLPNCYLNVQVGDIVFIAFEDNTERKAVILGHLLREAMSDSYVDIIAGDLDVRRSFTTSADVNIGGITYSELSSLQGMNGRIKDELELLQGQIEDLKHSLGVT